MRSLLHLLHMMFLLIGITLMILTPSSSALASNPTINWDVQLTMTAPTFQSVGMCKGTTEETSRVGFIGNELGAIWRTQDGVNWDQVVQFPDVSAYWYGIYCFPDAKRVIAVGFSDGDAVLKNGAIITWSFDGGNSWTERQPMPQSGGLTWLQSVFFYNDTHGVILPFTQDSLPLAYYTTNGGKNASDWKPVPLSGPIEVWQSHPISAFGGVTKAFAALQATNDTNLFCTSGNAGMKWDCGQSDHNILVGSFVSANNGIGLGGVNVFSVYVTHDGGQSWTNISSIPSGISAALVLPTDIVWIPNSDVVIVVGGNQEMGTVAHSLDRGLTWAEGIPQLRSTMFTSLDWAVTSSGIEVWTVGNDGGVSLVLHATVTFD